MSTSPRERRRSGNRVTALSEHTRASLFETRRNSGAAQVLAGYGAAKSVRAAAIHRILNACAAAQDRTGQDRFRCKSVRTKNLRQR